jgi:hypothetical protein
MSGTLAVVTVYRGHECVSAGFSEAEAADMAGAIAELGGWEAGPEVRDLLPGLEATFPVGCRVMFGRQVHWRPGQGGVVNPGELDSFARWPESGPSPWLLGADGAYVHVVLDDGYASWWRSTWLVPL